MPFQFVGINVLTVRQHDHIFHAAGDDKIPVAADIAEITGPEPLTGHHLSGVLRIPVIAGHHDRSSYPDLTNSIVPRLADADVNAANRSPDRSGVGGIEWRECDRRSRLRQ